MGINTFGLYIGVSLSVLAVLINIVASWLSEKFSEQNYRVLSLSTFMIFLLSMLVICTTNATVLSLLVVGLIGIAQAVNSLRGYKLRYGLIDSKARVLKETLSLSGLQVFVGLILSLDSQILLLIVLIAGLLSLFSTLYSLASIKKTKTTISSSDLPTVSLLIPARNEDHVLDQALANYIALSYPKLEIIVLDDCSHDRTPQIIKNYAHAGVRFVPGKPLIDDWTGKNHALQTLLNESSGEYVIFCDVDIRLSVNSINQLIETALSNHLSMISVMPGRREFDLFANLVQPIVEFWYLVWPLRDAVGGACMFFEASKLKSIGGFEPFKQSVVPEYSIAKQLKSSGYKLQSGADNLGITTRKKLSSIVDTQVRLLYPTLGSSLAIASSAILLVVSMFIVLPIYTAASGSVLGLSVILVAVANNLIITRIFNPKNQFLATINLPISALFFVIMIIKSTIDYEFRSVEWKKRNVCFPQIEVIASLPRV